MTQKRNVVFLGLLLVLTAVVVLSVGVRSDVSGANPNDSVNRAPSDPPKNTPKVTPPVVNLKSVELAPKVLVLVKDLRRTRQNTLVLKFSVKNNSGDLFELEKYYRLISKGAEDEPDLREITKVSLIEKETGKELQMMSTSSGNCICSHGEDLPDHIKPGESAGFWAQFPMPLASVKEIAVSAFGAPLIEAVPIAEVAAVR